MKFKMLVLPPYGDGKISERYLSYHDPNEVADAIRAATPEADVEVFLDWRDAREAIKTADAVYGMVVPDLLPMAKKLKWIAASGTGMGHSYYYDALAATDIVVTNPRGVYTQNLSAQVMGFVLAFARRFEIYWPRQQRREWNPDTDMVQLQECTALCVGVGNSGSAVAKRCAAFDMHVIGTDARTTQTPEGMAELYGPEKLDELLPRADFVLVTIPESPKTLGMFNAERFAKFKRGAYFINVGRGATVVTDDLVAALKSGHLGGAGLDVVIPEPLPHGHPLWSMPNVLITPHVSTQGGPSTRDRNELTGENARRFAAGQPLINIVDKKNWF